MTTEPRYWFAERPRAAGHGFPIIVFGPDGDLDLPLTLFAREVDRRLAHGTARTYLYAVLPFFTFLANDMWQRATSRSWDSPPAVVRQAVEAYLMEGLSCRVSVHRLGFSLVKRSARSPRTVNVFLSALKLFYRVMRYLGLYTADNPLVDATALTHSDIHRELDDVRDPPAMPSVSGVQAPPQPPSYRLSDSYFRLQNSDWVPHVIDDRAFPALVRAGAHSLLGWSARDECVLNLLFETGARISEVVGLSLGDWVAEGLSTIARAFSKGSHGERVKLLRFRPQTAKLLRRYVDGERRQHDVDGRTLQQYIKFAERGVLDLQTVPLFITRRGQPLTAKTFRQTKWNPACAAAQLTADPHQARHWFVTACVREIYAGCSWDGDVQRGKEALTAYMGWRSGERTLQAYEHVLKADLAADIQDRVHARLSEDLDHDVLSLERGDARQAPRAAAPEDDEAMVLLQRMLK